MMFTKPGKIRPASRFLCRYCNLSIKLKINWTINLLFYVCKRAGKRGAGHLRQRQNRKNNNFGLKKIDWPTWRLESCWFQVATWFSRKKYQTSQKRTGYSLPDRYTYLSSSRIFRNWAAVIRDILSKNKVYMCVMYLSLKDKKVNFCPFTLHCSKFHMRSNSWNRQPQALCKCNIPYSSN